MTLESLGFPGFRLCSLRIMIPSGILNVPASPAGDRALRAKGRRTAMKTLLRGGTVVNADGCRRLDVLLEGEKILQVGR